MRFPADELEKRLTEFQVVEAAEGQIVGAMAFKLSASTPCSTAKDTRIFRWRHRAGTVWGSIRTIAPHNGVFRFGPGKIAFLGPLGFSIPHAEISRACPGNGKVRRKLAHLPNQGRRGLTAVEKELAAFKEIEKKRSAEMLDQARA